MNIDDLLKTAVSAGASDLHLKVGAYPMMRVNGTLVVASEEKRLDRADTETMAAAMFPENIALLSPEELGSPPEEHRIGTTTLDSDAVARRTTECRARSAPTVKIPYARFRFASSGFRIESPSLDATTGVSQPQAQDNSAARSTFGGICKYGAMSASAGISGDSAARVTASAPPIDRPITATHECVAVSSR